MKTFTADYLCRKLIAASKAYYGSDDRIITDDEFDSLRDALIKLDPEHPFLKTIGFPVVSSEWKKATHKIQMLSLNKINSVDEFIKWTASIGDSSYIIEDKLDGISIDLEYDNGFLKKAITRGDGVIGEDIFNNVKRMRGVKIKLDNFTGCIRGEIFLLINDFKFVNRLRLRNGDKILKNPRNGANGIAKELNGTYAQYLTVYCYDIVSPKISFQTEFEKIGYIRNVLGLKVCFCKNVDVDKAIQVYNAYENSLRAKTPYDIDGLVVKAFHIDIQRRAGELGGRPKAKIAWKFGSLKKETKVIDIEWSLGRSGRVTPVAKVKETNLGGVTIEHVSLHNLELFKQMNIGKGDRVLISRRNDVIPYMEKVIESKGRFFNVPAECPSCGYSLIKEGKFLVCKNGECEALMVGNLSKWVDKLGIKEVGPALIKSLYASNIVKDPADFYTMNTNDIASLDRLGIKTATKVINNFNLKKQITLSEFIGGLNIPNVSNSIVDLIVDAGFDTMDKIQFDLSLSSLINIPGIERRTAHQILKGIKNKGYIIRKLMNVGITIKACEIDSISNKLNGLSFCFTGAIKNIDASGNRFTRKAMEDLVRKNGGKISAVKKGLHCLVIADPDSDSSKAKKARSLGINIIGEDNFFERIK